MMSKPPQLGDQQAEWWKDLHEYKCVRFSVFYPTLGCGVLVVFSDIEKSKYEPRWRSTLSAARNLYGEESPFHVSGSVLSANFSVIELRRAFHAYYLGVRDKAGVRELVLDWLTCHASYGDPWAHAFNRSLRNRMDVDDRACHLTFYARASRLDEVKYLFKLRTALEDAKADWFPGAGVFGINICVVMPINRSFGDTSAVPKRNSGPDPRLDRRRSGVNLTISRNVNRHGPVQPRGTFYTPKEQIYNASVVDRSYFSSSSYETAWSQPPEAFLPDLFSDSSPRRDSGPHTLSTVSRESGPLVRSRYTHRTRNGTGASDEEPLPIGGPTSCRNCGKVSNYPEGHLARCLKTNRPRVNRKVGDPLDDLEPHMNFLALESGAF